MKKINGNRLIFLSDPSIQGSPFSLILGSLGFSSLEVLFMRYFRSRGRVIVYSGCYKLFVARTITLHEKILEAFLTEHEQAHLDSSS